MTEGFASTFRMSGDEFSIIIRGTNSKDYIDSQLQRIRRLLNNPVQIDGKTIFPSATFGAVLDIQRSNDASQVMALAAYALTTGKKNAMGSITFISAIDGIEALKQQDRSNLLAVQADMRRALASMEFIPYFQPIYNLSPPRLVGFEALARWDHPSGIRDPDAFVPQAEETGLIAKIDKNVISRAIKIAKKWSDTHPEFPFFVSANASGASFKDPNFVPFILGRLEKAALDPKYFVLEFTEGIFIENFENAINKLNSLRSHGVKVALDDFGTGYSSLQYVSQLPLNYIKIDKAFISHVFTSQKTMLMVRSIIDMAAMLEFGVVAEGVDNVNQLNWLSKNENTKAQGYFFSPPVPQEGAENMLDDAIAFASLSPP